MAIDPAESIRRHDRGRDPRRVAIKYRKMAEDAFAFFRGSCPLFYERLAGVPAAMRSPHAWICGDLHLENFGTFRGGNGLTYFDVNDFDEACLAPCTWDVVRFLTSVLLAADRLRLSTRVADALTRTFVEGYARALSIGHADWIERRTARGIV